MTQPHLSRETTIGVLGAGAMGSGIAQVAAVHGHPVVLVDASPEAMQRARDGIARTLRREVEKGRMEEAAATRALDGIVFADAPADLALEAFRPCGLVIEAVVERLDVKRDVFGRLEAVVADDAVLATNTSSLSIASIASACARPERVLGVHFFNPAPIMPLVELVPGLVTSPQVLAATRALVEDWRKTVVVAADTPGFIVNRIARPFYGEALRLLEEGAADAATIDWAMRELGGFRMGPFELMDFIGNDVNYAVTRSVFEALFYDPRYRPSVTQQRLVEAGLLGRKSGRGYYEYGDGVERPAPRMDREIGRAILDRILCMLVNEAADAVLLRIASPADIDLAMTKGVNYPKGLLQWGDELGLEHVLGTLESLQVEYGDDRYRPSPLLRRMVRDGRRFRS